MEKSCDPELALTFSGKHRPETLVLNTKPSSFEYEAFEAFAVWRQASHFIALCPCFLICKMRAVMLSPGRPGDYNLRRVFRK